MRSQLALDLPPDAPWPEPVDGKGLLDEIRHLLICLVVMPRWAAEILALWVVHTFAFELRDVGIYIGIESPIRRCGKTRLMTVLSQLVNRPEAASNITSPAFYRAIEELRPTLFIDEADMLLPGNAELRGVLNSGYTRPMAYVLRVTNELPEGKSAGRSKGKRRSRLARFSCFGPKAIAQIGHLPATLADRCIVLSMQRKLPTEPCQRLRDLDKTVCERLRRQCARFVQDHAQEIATARPELPKTLNDRAADLCEPMLILADLAGSEWPALAAPKPTTRSIRCSWTLAFYLRSPERAESSAEPWSPG
jgi:hypothetical protein